MSLISVILAAGHGTRMKSRLPKMLHPLAGRPLVLHALDTAAALSTDTPVVVVGHGEDAVRQAVGGCARFAVQEQQLGTGHAVLAAEGEASGRADLVLVTYADMPLWKVETLRRLVETQAANPGPFSMVTVELPDPHGFGRVLRAADGSVTAIVEEAVASPEVLAVRELNASAFCFRSEWLWPALRRIRLSPKGEYFLTDLVEIAVAEGGQVRAIQTADASEAVGINTRVHLAEAEAILRRRTNEAFMLAGVTIVDPAATYIEPTVQIGADSVIWPNCFLRGKTVIGAGANIGPDTIIEDSTLGENCRVLASYIESSTLEDDVRMGPFCHLRPGAHLAKGVKMGNFGEVKASYLGAYTQMGHFSYIGDATIGERVNIGAGTITCNYDGKNKNRTEIGDQAFIGSDTMLVAPVRIGDRAKTGAGSVVTHDVPDDGVVVGVPARPFGKKTEGGD